MASEHDVYKASKQAAEDHMTSKKALDVESKPPAEPLEVPHDETPGLVIIAVTIPE